MMEDEISILSVFKDSGYDIILADEIKNEMVYREIPFKNIPLDELPDPDEKLENPDLRGYIERLQQEEIIYKTEKTQDFKVVWKSQGSNRISNIKTETVFKPYCEYILVDNIGSEKRENNKYRIVSKNNFIKTLRFGKSIWNVGNEDIEKNRYYFCVDQGKMELLINNCR